MAARATRLTLVCHAATAASRAAAFPGDDPLDDRGRAAAAAVQTPSVPPDACWTSPAAAARQTAAAMGLTAVVDPLLREADYGRWAGQSLPALAVVEPGAVEAWLRDPGAAPHGGETRAALLARVAGWLDGQAQSAGRIVAVTHAAVIRAAVIHAIEAGPASFGHLDVAPLTQVALRHDGRRWTLAAFGREER